MGSGHQITSLEIFHCTVATDMGRLWALWQYPDYNNNQMHRPNTSQSDANSTYNYIRDPLPNSFSNYSPM